jgi:hypothetical protein
VWLVRLGEAVEHLRADPLCGDECDLPSGQVELGSLPLRDHFDAVLVGKWRRTAEHG